MLRLGKFILLSFLLITAVLIFVKSLEYYTPDFSKGYLSDKKEVFDGVFKYGLYAHILSVPFILIAGTAQAFFRYEYTNRKLHRAFGNIYCYLILFISAPGAFILSFYAFGGIWGKLSFWLLTILWAWVTFQGLIYGKQKNIVKHKSYMIRSYVLTISAIMLRLISFVFIHGFDFYGEVAYAIAAWMSWVPTLLIVEGYLQYKKRTSFSLPSA